MTIVKQYLTPNEYSRPCKKIKEVRGLVMHWTAAPEQTARQVRNFFESRKTGNGGYGSAHYIIDQSGEIIAAIPEDEVAYHCGTDKLDPTSGKLYTDYARAVFGRYATQHNSPNNCTLSIELCPKDEDGRYTSATIDAAALLAADILRRHGLTTNELTAHFEVVGWKLCPKTWAEKPELLDIFRLLVADKMLMGE